MKCWLGLAPLAVIVSICSGWAGAQTIEGVTLVPATPSHLTPFRVDITGEELYVETTPADPFFAYSRTGSALRLDLLFLLPEGAISPGSNPYSASYVVEGLPAGAYTLEVRGLTNGQPGGGTVVPFTVVPEPAALAAIPAAALLLTRPRRTRAGHTLVPAAE